MAGSLLTTDGDVQVGSDRRPGFYSPYAPLPLLLRRNTTLWAAQFSPWTELNVESSDMGDSGRHGTRAAVDSAGSRRIDFTIWLKTTTAADARAKLKSLNDILSPPQEPLRNLVLNTVYEEQELAFQMLGKKYVMYGHYRAVGIGTDAIPGQFQFPVKVRFDATDPLIYACDETTIELSVCPVRLAFTGGTFGYEFADANTTATPLAIAGQAAPRWRALLRWAPSGGTVTNPVLANVTDKYMTGLGIPGWNIILSTGQLAEFVSGTRTATRYDSTSSSWMNYSNFITPGSGWNTIRNGAKVIYVPWNTPASGPGTQPVGATATLYYQPSYWLPE